MSARVELGLQARLEIIGEALLALGRFLREADELQRTIQLQALALGFGAGFFALPGYRIFERLGAPAADIADFTMVMAFFYVIGAFLGWRRYR